MITVVGIVMVFVNAFLFAKTKQNETFLKATLFWYAFACLEKIVTVAAVPAIIYEVALGVEVYYILRMFEKLVARGDI